jgi:predicted O-methyltransferase YrrM
MTEYQFTKDWFNWAPEVWNQLIPMLPERTDDGRNFLEIGSFEGRSTIWTIANMMSHGDWIDCVDTWEGGEEHSEEDMGSVEERFDRNIDAAIATTFLKEYRPEMALGHTTRYGHTEFGNRVNVYKYKCRSSMYLASKLNSYIDSENLFDFIYIDGSHIAKDVLTDACMAWPLLKPQGLMVFDDYMWGDPRDALHRPKIAIDAFTTIFGETAEIIHVGYQLVVRKK